MKRPAIQPGTTGLITTAAVCAGAAVITLADDLREPYAALSIVSVATVATSAVRRLITRAETAEDKAAAAQDQAAAAKRELAEERARRSSVEREYRDLVEDYNDLARAEARRLPRPATGHEDHGPRCQCRRRGPRPFLTLIDSETRQGSA